MNRRLDRSAIWRFVVGVILTLSALLLVACGGGSDQISVGADAPDFSLPQARGGEVALDDYQGQPVLLYFHMAVG